MSKLEQEPEEIQPLQIPQDVLEGQWQQLTIDGKNKPPASTDIRGVPYETFMKFYKLCPIWAIRYKTNKVSKNWGSMKNVAACVLGEFNHGSGEWSSRFGDCAQCYRFGMGSCLQPSFYNGKSEATWQRAIIAFVDHVEEKHPERLA